MKDLRDNKTIDMLDDELPPKMGCGSHKRLSEKSQTDELKELLSQHGN